MQLEGTLGSCTGPCCVCADMFWRRGKEGKDRVKEEGRRRSDELKAMHVSEPENEHVAEWHGGLWKLTRRNFHKSTSTLAHRTLSIQVPHHGHTCFPSSPSAPLPRPATIHWYDHSKPRRQALPRTNPLYLSTVVRTQRHSLPPCLPSHPAVYTYGIPHPQHYYWWV